MSQFERLTATLGFRDLMSPGLGKAEQKLSSFTGSFRAASGRIVAGSAAMAAGIAGLVAALNPADEMDRMRGGLASLGVGAQGLDLLENSAKRFAKTFGGSAADVVASAYDLKSAISSLTDQELADSVFAANVLGKATKAAPAIVTNYLGTLYGIFTEQADAQGRAAWVKLASGMSAQAVQAFKLDGGKLNQFFGQLGAAATSAGHDMATQFSVAGILGSSMEGGMAATKYNAFLAGVGNAQKELGVKFTDAQGRMMGLADMLDVLHTRFGALDTVAERDLIKKAFGGDEAFKFVDLMIGKVGDLRKSQQSMAAITGLGDATKMANDWTTMLDRLKGKMGVVWLNFSQSIARWVAPAMAKLDVWMDRMSEWPERFPRVTRAVAGLATAFLGLSIAGGLVAISSGLMTLAATPALLTFTRMAVAVAFLVEGLNKLSEASNAWNDAIAAKKQAKASTQFTDARLLKELEAHPEGWVNLSPQVRKDLLNRYGQDVAPRQQGGIIFQAPVKFDIKDPKTLDAIMSQVRMEAMA